MKKILYTVCSANHLAHCKTMADSFVAFNREYTVVIALVDKIEGRFDANEFAPYRLIEAGEMGIPGFAAMTEQYSVIELNCAMKAFVAQYIFKQMSPDLLFYLDSDIQVFHSFEILEKMLDNNALLITPHFTQPLPDKTLVPRERDFIRSGLFNAGFMAFSNGEIASKFLSWWAEHMQDECYYNFEEGMGVDQVWLNLVPLLFDKVGIVNHPGANLAYWNLHERKLVKKEGLYFVNESSPLLFLHISGYQFDRPEILSRHQNRFQLNEQDLLKEILMDYRTMVKQNGYDRFSPMRCAYARQAKKPKGIMKLMNMLLKPIGIQVNRIKP